MKKNQTREGTGNPGLPSSVDLHNARMASSDAIGKHDLEEKISELSGYLKAAGVPHLIAAWPLTYPVFNGHGGLKFSGLPLIFSMSKKVKIMGDKAGEPESLTKAIRILKSARVHSRHTSVKSEMSEVLSAIPGGAFTTDPLNTTDAESAYCAFANIFHGAVMASEAREGTDEMAELEGKREKALAAIDLIQSKESASDGNPWAFSILDDFMGIYAVASEADRAEMLPRFSEEFPELMDIFNVVLEGAEASISLKVEMTGGHSRVGDLIGAGIGRGGPLGDLLGSILGSALASSSREGGAPGAGKYRDSDNGVDGDSVEV